VWSAATQRRRLAAHLVTVGEILREAVGYPSAPVQPARRDLPPVVVLGGASNAVSIARTLSRAGVKVYAINKPDAAVRHSRFAQWMPIEARDDAPAAWTEFLLGPRSDHLRGAVLLAANDAGIEIIARHRDALAGRFLLDESNPDAQLRMLDKLTTYQAAAAAGVTTPRFWEVNSAQDLEGIRDELVYPLLVKPKISHSFTSRFCGKHLVAANFSELVQGCEKLTQAGVSFLLTEKIPGPDDRLCSYYTYLDDGGRPLFHFTKRIIRRYPLNMGIACYHVTDWNPEVRNAALRLFQAVGLRGLANAEFKRDARDGKLKLIECNARFTEANGLVARSGFDLARFVYNRIVSLPTPPMDHYRVGLRLWYPLNDYRAFRELHERGELTFLDWIGSLRRPMVLPLLDWRDPLPSLHKALQRLRAFAEVSGHARPPHSNPARSPAPSKP